MMNSLSGNCAVIGSDKTQAHVPLDWVLLLIRSHFCTRSFLFHNPPTLHLFKPSLNDAHYTHTNRNRTLLEENVAAEPVSISARLPFTEVSYHLHSSMSLYIQFISTSPRGSHEQVGVFISRALRNMMDVNDFHWWPPVPICLWDGAAGDFSSAHLNTCADGVCEGVVPSHPFRIHNQSCEFFFDLLKWQKTQ